MIITLIQEAYLTGAYLRLPTEDGQASVFAMEGNWYEATAVDDDGNEYLVLWEIRDSVDINTLDDESDACDWENPVAVVQLDPWRDVTSKVTEIRF